MSAFLGSLNLGIVLKKKYVGRSVRFCSRELGKGLMKQIEVRYLCFGSLESLALYTVSGSLHFEAVQPRWQKFPPSPERRDDFSNQLQMAQYPRPG
jgi:hypothetical protein